MGVADHMCCGGPWTGCGNAKSHEASCIRSVMFVTKAILSQEQAFSMPRTLSQSLLKHSIMPIFKNELPFAYIKPFRPLAYNS